MKGETYRTFASYLQDYRIVVQQMNSMPEQNGMAESKTRTLMDMVKNIMSICHLPESLLCGALKTTAHSLNRVPSKVIFKTLFELWTDRKPILSNLRV